MVLLKFPSLSLKIDQVIYPLPLLYRWSLSFVIRHIAQGTIKEKSGVFVILKNTTLSTSGFLHNNDCMKTVMLNIENTFTEYF